MLGVDVKAFAIALGNTIAGLFLLSSILFAALPQAVGWVANMFHIDVTGLYRPLGLFKVLIGTIVWWLIAGAIGGIAATLYNGIAQK